MLCIHDRELFNSYVFGIHLSRQQEQMIVLRLRVVNPVNMALNVDQQIPNSMPVILKMEITSTALGKQTYLGELVFFLFFPFLWYLQGHFMSQQ